MDKVRHGQCGYRLIAHRSDGKHLCTIEKVGTADPVIVNCSGLIKPDIDKNVKYGVQVYIMPRGFSNSGYRHFNPDDELFMYMMGIFFVQHGFPIQFEEFFIKGEDLPTT